MKSLRVTRHVFDKWMSRSFPEIPFERYADDMICHCRNAEEARVLRKALEARFAACKLVMHPQKTQLVYCTYSGESDQ